MKRFHRCRTLLLPSLAVLIGLLLGMSPANCAGTKAKARKDPAAKSPATPAIECIEPNAASGSSRVVVVDDVPLAHTAQFLPLNSRGQVVGQGRPRRQARQVIENLGAALKETGAGLNTVVKLNVSLARAADKKVVEQTLADTFSGPVKPAVSFVVGKLAHPDALVAMDAVAAISGEDVGRAVTKNRSPALPGRDSIAHVSVLPAGPKVYVSGMAEKGELAEATRKTLEKLLAAIGSLDLDRSHVVQLKAFLQPMTGVALVEQEIARFFDDGLAPPVVYVEWLSKDLPIEIELIAAAKRTDKAGADSVDYLTPPGTTSSKVYSRIARVNHGRLVYVSGLYGNHSTAAAEQIREIFRVLDPLTKKAGSDMNHLVKATYYVATAEASGRLNEIRPEFYDPQRPPAASKALVPGTGIPDQFTTLDMIAVTTPTR